VEAGHLPHQRIGEREKDRVRVLRGEVLESRGLTLRVRPAREDEHEGRTSGSMSERSTNTFDVVIARHPSRVVLDDEYVRFPIDVRGVEEDVGSHTRRDLPSEQRVGLTTNGYSDRRRSRNPVLSHLVRRTTICTIVQAVPTHKMGEHRYPARPMRRENIEDPRGQKKEEGLSFDDA
jgi:hypothetical protein